MKAVAGQTSATLTNSYCTINNGGRIILLTWIEPILSRDLDLDSKAVNSISKNVKLKPVHSKCVDLVSPSETLLRLLCSRDMYQFLPHKT